MTDRVALVTGASSGIGEAAAGRLLADGFVVYAGARRLDRMTGLAGAGAVTVAVDVTDDASMVHLVDRIVAERGRIDVLVNNAGYGSYGAVEDVPLEEGRRQLEVNLFGLARLTQLVIPHMRRAGRGRVINVSSIGGRFGEPLGAWYHASKFAVEGFSDSLRLELADFGIQVIVIEPGAINTEWGPIALGSAEQWSGEGPYAAHLAAMRRTWSGAEQAGSGPEVVAEAIGRAASARRPRLRYAVPWSAKALMLAVRLLPDRAMYRVARAVLLRGGVDTSGAGGRGAAEPG